MKILFEKPKGWEYHFFSSVLADELHLNQELRWDLKYELEIRNIRQLRDQLSLSVWLTQKLADIQGLCRSSETLTNSALPEALREPGVSGDLTLKAVGVRRTQYLYLAF